MFRFSEGRACEAVVQCLEERAALSRENLCWPEKEGHLFPVEAAFTIGDELFALEHTGIEPFKGHHKLNAEAEKHFKPIINTLNDYLGRNSEFELVIPASAFRGRREPEVRTIQAAIVHWFKATAFTIPTCPYSGRRSWPPSVGPVMIPGVPFPLSLYRFEAILTSSHPFDIVCNISNSEKLCTERVAYAIKGNFPKLAGWKRSSAARTVLVLETNSYLADKTLIVDAFLPLAIAREDRPDETYLVDTSNDRWLVLPILIDDATFFDFLESADPRPPEFDPEKLLPLTSR
jgi:hypothetical protein